VTAFKREGIPMESLVTLAARALARGASKRAIEQVGAKWLVGCDGLQRSKRASCFHRDRSRFSPTPGLVLVPGMSERIPVDVKPTGDVADHLQRAISSLWIDLYGVDVVERALHKSRSFWSRESQRRVGETFIDDSRRGGRVARRKSYFTLN
jgi:hypothetical protein